MVGQRRLIAAGAVALGVAGTGVVWGLQARTEVRARDRALETLRAADLGGPGRLTFEEYGARVDAARGPVEDYLRAYPGEAGPRTAIARAMAAHRVAVRAWTIARAVDVERREAEARQRYGELGRDEATRAVIEACPALRGLIEAKLALGPYRAHWTPEETRGAYLGLYPWAASVCAGFHLTRAGA
jgi:hypothetical protein